MNVTEKAIITDNYCQYTGNHTKPEFVINSIIESRYLQNNQMQNNC